MKASEIPISQSLMNHVLGNPCPYDIKLKWFDKVDVQPTDVMKRGHYFEYCVIGDSSSSAPQLEKLKSGGKSQAEKDIDELAAIAKATLIALGINLEDAITQVRVEGNGLSGLIDMVATDIQDPKRKAIYDLKYTETKYDDRFAGWADLETKISSKRQAKHYIHLWHQMHGEYLPYYFLVFGKAGWCRVIKCILMADSLHLHLTEIQVVRNMLLQWEANGWKATPEYEKCRNCRVASHCNYYKVVPEIESFEV